MALRKEDLLFKKVFAKKSITEAAADRPFFSEPYTAALSLEATNIWTETDKLPLVAPSEWVSNASYNSGDVVVYTTDSSNALNLCYKAKTTHSGESGTPAADSTNWEVFPQLKWASTIGMAGVTGAPYAFQDDDLKDTVPFSFGTSGYGYTFKKSGGSQISFGEKNWTFDTEAGAVYFHDDSLPSSIGTPTMTCFVYTGGKINTFISTGQIGIGTNAPKELLHIAGSSDPTLMIQNTSANDANSGKIAFYEQSNTVERVGLRYDGNANKFIIDTEEVANAFVMDRGTGDVTLSGNLTVNGTTTTINSTTLSVDDKNIEMGSVTTPTDATADGGGITLKGATDKTILWTDSDDLWHYNQGIFLETGTILQFRDSDIKISSSLDGRLDFDADTMIDLDCATDIQMSSNRITFGRNNHTDTEVIFPGGDNQGKFWWMEDEDYFEYEDAIRFKDDVKISFRDSQTYIQSDVLDDLQLKADSNIKLTVGNIRLEAHSIYIGKDDGTNPSLYFLGNTFDGRISWMEDEDRFVVFDELAINEKEEIIFGVDLDTDYTLVRDGNVLTMAAARDDGENVIKIIAECDGTGSQDDAQLLLGPGIGFDNLASLSGHKVNVAHGQDSGFCFIGNKVALHDILMITGSTDATDIDYGLIEDYGGGTPTGAAQRDYAHTYAAAFQALINDQNFEFNSDGQQQDAASTIAYHQQFRNVTNMNQRPTLVTFLPDPKMSNSADPNISDCLFNYSMLGYSTHLKQIPRKIDSHGGAQYERGEYGYWFDGGLH